MSSISKLIKQRNTLLIEKQENEVRRLNICGHMFRLKDNFKSIQNEKKNNEAKKNQKFHYIHSKFQGTTVVLHPDYFEETNQETDQNNEIIKTVIMINKYEKLLNLLHERERQINIQIDIIDKDLLSSKYTCLEVDAIDIEINKQIQINQIQINHGDDAKPIDF